MPASDRVPEPRASPSSTVSAWSSSVCPSSTVACAGVRLGVQRLIARLPGGGLRAAGARVDRDRSDDDVGVAHAPSAGFGPASATSAEPGCRPWSTTIAAYGQLAADGPVPGREGQRQRVGAARAGDEQRRDRVRSGRLGRPGRRPGLPVPARAVPSTVAGLSDGGRARHAPGPATAPGSAISARVGSVSGEVQTWLRPVHADRVDHRAAEGGAVAVLPHLGVQAEQLADDLVEALALAADGELRRGSPRRWGSPRARRRPSRRRRDPRAATSRR